MNTFKPKNIPQGPCDEYIAEITRLEAENAEMADAAGDALGTDKSLRGKSCVTALVNHVAWLREELDELRSENAELRLQLARARETLKDEAGEQYGCS